MPPELPVMSGVHGRPVHSESHRNSNAKSVDVQMQNFPMSTIKEGGTATGDENVETDGGVNEGVVAMPMNLKTPSNLELQFSADSDGAECLYAANEQDVQAYAAPMGPGGGNEMDQVAGMETASGLGEAL